MEGITTNQHPYYLINLNESGEFIHSHPEKLFIIPMESEVRIRIKQGLSIANEPILLVNTPLKLKDGTLQYTITQPRFPILSNEPSLQTEEQFKIQNMDGSQIKANYLEEVRADESEDNMIEVEFRVMFQTSGSFFIQIEYFDEILKDRNVTKPQYLNVEPVLYIRGEKVRGKELSIMSVHSRLFGTVDRWNTMFKNISTLNYNAVHFMPIQSYGLSYSHYSLKDQTSIDNYFFGGSNNNLSQNQMHRDLSELIQNARDNHGVASIIDIVLNHTSLDSDWLLEHPEAGYSLETCPQLYSAWLLDSELAKFSDLFAEKKVNECGFAPYINNKKELEQVINAMRNRVFDQLKMHEFFLFNVNRQIDQARKFVNQAKDQQNEDPINLSWHKKELYTLFQDNVLRLGEGPIRLNITLHDHFIFFLFIKSNKNIYQMEQSLRQLMERHNQEWTHTIQQYMKDALDNCIYGTMKYEILEQKNNKISKEKKMLKRYFTELDNKEESKLANNGWIGNAKPFEDFAMHGWHYLKRDINIWEDSVKLRYGSCPSDSQFLWDHMSEYVSRMAQIFDGFRLDNAHSTPLHVCNYMLQISRTQNPNLYVMAELFTSSAPADAIFVKTLNINGLVRELQNTNNAQHLGAYFHEITCQEAMIGSLDKEFEDINGEKYFELLPKKPNDIIYDQTHDNPAPIKKYLTASVALPIIGLYSLADQAIATTWGCDLLLNDQINVVNEKRLYQELDNQEIFVFSSDQEEEKQSKQERFPEKTPEPYDINYEFEFYSDHAKKVEVAIDFTGWNREPLEKVDDKKWSKMMCIPKIDNHDIVEFKFVVDNQWVVNDKLPMKDNGHGDKNNYLQVNQTKQSDIEVNNENFVLKDIRYARMKLNQIHFECTRENAEIFMHEQNPEVLLVYRQFPLDYSDSYDQYVSITRFNHFNNQDINNSKPEIELPGVITEIVFAGYLKMPQNAHHKESKDFIVGAEAKFKVFKNLNQFCKVDTLGDKQKLIFHNMPSTFTCVLKTRSSSIAKQSFQNLRALDLTSDLSISQQLFDGVSLAGLNHLLFRCKDEEKDISNSERGPYGFDKRGQMKYAGISSFMHYFRKLKLTNNLGDEMLENIRKGNWLLTYSIDRLSFMDKELQPVSDYMREYKESIENLPISMRPKFTVKLIEKVYNASLLSLLKDRIKGQFIRNLQSNKFIQHLSLGIVQMWGRVPSVYFEGQLDSMCAGLPHFSTGYMRCWGRDTFISMKGLFTLTGLEDEGRQTILFFAKLLRHGLIPNLHDRGKSTRYNARDAVWFFLQAVVDYIKYSDEGISFLNVHVPLYFKDDNQHIHEQLRDQDPKVLTIEGIIMDILQKHAQGIDFREWNEGIKIDEHMKQDGFNVKVKMDLETGFCFGGNQNNCGTWMDKMGSGEKNKGIPATPRDGAPIELVALQYSVLSFLGENSGESLVLYKGIKLQDDQYLTFENWALKIKNHFESCFWIPINENEDNQYQIVKKFVNRRGIYKDTYKSSQGFTDYQLRPNICVALSYAPTLFDKDHAQTCLKVIESVLVEQGCMGIKTLDPSDKKYNGDYNNQDDSRGWNYHQGPEWLWPFGYFLKAKVLFTQFERKQEVVNDIMKYMLPHEKHIVNEEWESLPELTNKNGKVCEGSCKAQAWSVSSILEAIWELNNFQE